jgi:hypothetical protein
MRKAGHGLSSDKFAAAALAWGITFRQRDSHCEFMELTVRPVQFVIAITLDPFSGRTGKDGTNIFKYKFIKIISVMRLG